MSDRVEELNAALAGRYRIVTEPDGGPRVLGRGGMATVYLAEDLRHQRRVALKTLRPELAPVLGTDRFLQEIRLSASLSHPNIVPLFDSGQIADTLFFVMPLIEGESLRQRLNRTGRMPLDEATSAVLDVAEALAHAHSKGIIHRDIKPENILLAGARALVADFGLAYALSSAESERLTGTGIALGTPGYMSPEQAAGEDVDCRTDIYSLACVAYELVSGVLPFRVPDARVINAALFFTPPPSLKSYMSDVPRNLDTAILRGLAPTPSNRYASATDFAKAIRSGPTRLQRRSFFWSSHSPMARVALIAAAIVLSSAVVYAARHRRPAIRSDPNLIAIWPFRVSTTDPAIAYLREGMIDLIATQLDAGGGLRAVNPGTVLNAWATAKATTGTQPADPELGKLSAALGAGRFISGSLVGTPSQLVITAAVGTSVTAGGATQVFSVAGSADTLPALVQALIGRLLAAELKVSGEDPSLLTRVPLAVLRPYLEGKTAFRHGHWDRAGQRFSDALAVDSTFAPAALQLVFLIRGMGGDRAFGDELRLAMANRQRLNPDERALVQALAGPHYPARSGGMRGDLAAWEHATELFPNRAEIWYNLGLELHDRGALLGIERWVARARVALARALTIDSSFVAAFRPSIEIAASQGDSAEVRQLWQRLLSIDSTVDDVPYLRWRVAAMLGDSLVLSRARRALDSASVGVLRRVYGRSVFDGLPPVEAENACTALERQAQTSSARALVAYCWNWLSMIEGRRAASNRAYAIQRSQAVPNDSVLIPLMLHDEIAAVLAGEADSARGSRAAGELAQILARPYPSNWGYSSRLVAACGIANWHLWRGDTLAAERTISRITPEDELTDGGFCRTLFKATVAVGHRDTNATELLARADSMARAGTSLLELWEGNLRIARLWEAEGQPSRALSAVRRRSNAEAWIYLTTPYLREECRLASDLDERAAAIRACQHFLTLRSKADSTLSGEIEGARTRLNRLRNN